MSGPSRALLAAVFLNSGLLMAQETQSLAGEWQVRLDPKVVGLSQNWIAPEVQFEQTMTLPGTTDEAGLGVDLAMQPVVSKEGLARLHRKHSFILNSAVGIGKLGLKS